MPKEQYVDFAPRTTERWDTERFTSERDRAHGQEVTRVDERNVRMSGALRPPRRRDHSADTDDLSDRRGPRGGYEEDYVREREVYRDEPRDLPVRSRTTVEREPERKYYRSPSPPRMKRPARPSMLRRQSSLDTFDRKPTIPRYVEREQYGPPALRSERVYDDDSTVYTGRVREREIVRSRRRSVSSSSSSDSSEASSVRTSKSTWPRRGKTRMPAKLVSKRAIIELGYPFEEEGSTIIIQRALGRHHIDEVLSLSERYRSETTKIIEEKHTERVYSPPIPAPHHIVHAPSPPPPPPALTLSSHGPEIIQVDPPRATHHHSTDLVRTTRGAIYEERFNGPPYGHYRSRSMGPTPRHEYIEPSLAIAPIPAFPHRHYHDHHHHHDGRIVRVERIEDAEYSRAPDGELVLYHRDREFLEPVAAVRRDRKGPNPRAIRTMMRFLT